MARTTAAPTLPQTRRAAARLARTSSAAPIGRRVYRTELRAALGFSATWFLVLQGKGVIPKGHRDRDGGREWFTEAEAKKIVDQINKHGTRVPEEVA
ncbi:MAG TPA: hypothetical protein VF814_21805 [Casimicrobiaceae bacterium]